MRILYIDIDSLRPANLGCYGYHRNTSPAIDAVAADAVRFERCYTPDAPCLPSRTALYSGRFGIHTGVVSHGGTAATPKNEGAARGWHDRFGEDGLANQLQKAGFHTAMISPFGQRHSAHWFYAGFNEIHNTGKDGLESAEDVRPVIEKWLHDNAESDHWFLHVNLWDPHTPYRVPLEYGNPFADEPLPEWITREGVLESHQKQVGPHSALDIGMYNGDESPEYPRQPGSLTDATQLRRMIDGYDTGVKYADDQIGRIVSHLKSIGVYDDTVIIISADHGENMGELGIYGEHGTADRGTCNIPLIIKWPGATPGVNSKFHYNVDLAPTLMELLEQTAPAIWDGRSFAPAITSAQSDSGRDELVISQCTHVAQRSVLWDDWLYVRTYHDGFHLFPEEMLFNLADDPHEQNDVAAQNPDIVREGAWRLMRWHDAQMNKMARESIDSVDPLWSVIREGGPFYARLTSPGWPQGGGDAFKAYLQRLEDTGRVEGAKALRAKYADDL